MNTAITVVGWIGWITVIGFLGVGAWLLWASMANAMEPPTNPNLAKCDECGWVEGVNDDCDTCQRVRSD